MGLNHRWNGTFTAARRPATNVAIKLVAGAMIDPLLQQIEDHVVDAKRLGDVKFSSRVQRCRIGGQSGDVLRPVFSRPQKERTDDNALRTAFNALRVSRCNRRFGKFHMRRFDDVIMLGESIVKQLSHLL